MTDSPRFTILTCVLNRRKDIEGAINSVIAQKFPHFEFIIVDNGSTDGTYEYCKTVSFDKLKLLQCPERGLAFARNTGIRAARGEYIVLLDSDNLLASPDTLGTIDSMLRVNGEPTGLFLSCIDDRGRSISSGITGTRRINFSDFVNAMQGEFGPVIRTSWFKQHLYPEIKGARTEFPSCAWYPLTQEEIVFASDVVIKIYGTGSDGRICGVEVPPVRARELAFYYWMILRDHGERIWTQAGFFAYLSTATKFLVYNRLSSAIPSSDAHRVISPLFSFPFTCLPQRLLRASVEGFKRARASS